MRLASTITSEEELALQPKKDRSDTHSESKSQEDSNTESGELQHESQQKDEKEVAQSEPMDVSGESGNGRRNQSSATKRENATAKILFNDLFCVDKAGDVARLSDGTLPSDTPIYNRSSSSIIGEEKVEVMTTSKAAGGEIYRPPKLW